MQVCAFAGDFQLHFLATHEIAEHHIKKNSYFSPKQHSYALF